MDSKHIQVVRALLTVGTAACVLLFAACASKVAPVVGSDLGMQAPGFTLQNADEKPVSLSDYAGTPKVLLFYRGQW